MKALAARQIIKILEANGFALTRQRGSHMIFDIAKQDKWRPYRCMAAIKYADWDISGNCEAVRDRSWSVQEIGWF